MSDRGKPDLAQLGDTHTARAAGNPTAPGAIEQPSLLPGATEAERDALLPLAKAAKPRKAHKGQGGRPSGARNRRTDLMASYLVERYGDPLEGHVSIGMMPIRDLITELNKVASDCGIQRGYSVMDVVRLQADLRSQALPYIHAKRAAEDSKGKAVDLPVIGIGRAENVQIVAGGLSIEDRLARAKTIDNKGEIDDDAK